jgi:hypothetical protein
MEEAGLVPLGGIMLTLVLHQAAERGEYEVLILRQRHEGVPLLLQPGVRWERVVTSLAPSSVHAAPSATRHGRSRLVFPFIRSGLAGSGGLVEGRDGNLVATDLRRAFNHFR